MKYPSVGVIIPTFNCMSNLQTCLERLSVQDYPGTIEIFIIDGGSEDGTIEVAKNYTKHVYVNPGQYAEGLTGGRHFGEIISDTDLLWYVDSDNFIVEEDALTSLVKPLINDPMVNISIPVTSIDGSDHFLNNWIALREIYFVNQMIKRSKLIDNYYVIEDMDYGLTNCSLVRKVVVDEAGGRDSDVRLLHRIRDNSNSKGAIVPEASFYHDQFQTLGQFMRKWTNRAYYFSKMDSTDLTHYFVEYPPSYENEKALKKSLMSDTIGAAIISLWMFLHKRNIVWLGGLLYALIVIFSVITHPNVTFRVWKKFL